MEESVIINEFYSDYYRLKRKPIYLPLNLNVGNCVMSTPSPPPYCFATFSNSAANSLSISGVASTSFPPAALKSTFEETYKFNVQLMETKRHPHQHDRNYHSNTTNGQLCIISFYLFQKLQTSCKKCYR